MARRLECPLKDYPDGWIELPDKWLGEHANIRDEAVEKLVDIPKEKRPKPTAQNWIVALALLEDWGGIEAMNGNPDKWDYGKIDLNLIGWISETVLGDFNQCFVIKKKS